MDIKSKKIDIVPIEKLVLNPANNNKHPDEQIERLARIIEFNGFRDPVIVSNRSGFVVCGEARVKAAKKIAMKALPVVYQDFRNEAEEYQFLTAHNEIAKWSTIDRDSFIERSRELETVEKIDFEFYGIEFDFTQLKDEETSTKEPQSDPDKKLKLEITFKNEMEMNDLKDELISKGFNVRVL